MGEDFWPANYDPSLVDEVIAVSDADAFAMAREMTQREGLLIGGSGGTAVAAALRVAATLPDEAVVVVLDPRLRARLSLQDLQRRVDERLRLPATPRRRWTSVTCWPRRSSVSEHLADLVLVTEDTLVRDAISFMRENDVSQLLVTVTDELPLAAKEVSGSLSELGLLEATTRDESVLDLRVKDIADPLDAYGGRGHERQRAHPSTQYVRPACWSSTAVTRWAC